MKSWQWLTVSAVILLLISYLDFLTGYELQFFLFYFLPISIAAMRAQRAIAYSIALASAVCWLLADIYSQHAYTTEWIRIWNTFIRLLSFLIVAELFAKTRSLIDEQRQLNRQLSHSLEQVKLLQGLLRVCSSCKRICNKEGEWEQMEAYIQRHSEADFTHGFCPECLKKLYPDLMGDSKKGIPG